MLQWTLGCMYLFELEFSLGIYPGVGLQDHIAALFLIFKGTSTLCFIFPAPIYIPTNNWVSFNCWLSSLSLLLSPSFISCFCCVALKVIQVVFMYLNSFLCLLYILNIGSWSRGLIRFGLDMFPRQFHGWWGVLSEGKNYLIFYLLWC